MDTESHAQIIYMNSVGVPLCINCKPGDQHCRVLSGWSTLETEAADAGVRYTIIHSYSCVD